MWETVLPPGQQHKTHITQNPKIIYYHHNHLLFLSCFSLIHFSQTFVFPFLVCFARAIVQVMEFVSGEETLQNVIAFRIKRSQIAIHTW